MPVKVVIMRGIPGSGKSHLAGLLAKEYDGVTKICSADYWHERSGEYKWDPKQIGRAHLECRRAFHNALFKHDPGHDWGPDTVPPGLIIVDNTNTTPAEIAFYQELASLYTQDITIYHVVPPGYKKPKMNHRREVETLDVHDDWIHSCAERNQHGVPLDSIYKMWNRIHENKLPWHWNEVKITRHEGYFTLNDQATIWRCDESS